MNVLLCFILAPLMFAILLYYLPGEALPPLLKQSILPFFLKRGHIVNNANI